MPLVFDPNVPNDVKQSLRNNRAAPTPATDWGTVNAMAYGAPETHNALGGAGYRRPVSNPNLNFRQQGQVAAGVPVTDDTGASTSAAPGNSMPSYPSMDDTTAQNTAALNAGLKSRTLPQGVVRSSIPGVYLARGKDGSFMASNVMGADGMPDFGGTSQAGQRMGLRARNANPGGTQVSGVTNVPYDVNGVQGGEIGGNSAITDRAGWSMAPGAQGGTYDPNAGQVDASGAASLPGAATGPNAGYTYAQNSLRSNPADQISAAGINPDRAQGEVDRLMTAIQEDPNANNPEVAAANRAALAQLQGNVQDVRKEYWGSNGGMYGALAGGAGTGTGGGGRGVGLRDLLTNRYRNAQLAERSARDQATEAYRQQMADRADKAEARQDAQYFTTNFQAADAKTPGSGANLIEQAFPQGMTQAQYEEYFTKDPKGRAIQAALLQEMQNGAASALYPTELYDKANLGQNVNWGNMKLDKNGDFAGFYDEEGVKGGSNEYPRKSWLGNPNYNERLLSSIPSAAWKALQQTGLRRSM